MPVQPTNPPTISDLPDAPNSVTDSPSEFDAKANSFVTAQVGQVASYNTANQWAKTTVQQTYDNAIEAAASAVSSEESAEEAAIYAANSAGSANYVGVWSNLNGALSKPASVLHNNTYWRLNNNLTNVASSEPSPTNSNWSAITAYKWSVGESSSVLAINSYQLLDAFGSNVNKTIPLLGAGDFVAINNSGRSTANIILNIPNGVTIYGASGSMSSADNLILQSGETVHIAAESSTIWRAV